MVQRKKDLSIWLMVMTGLFVFMLTVTILLTQNMGLRNAVNAMFGGEQRYLKSGNPEEYQYYQADYTSKKDVLQAAEALNEKICEEGGILLKNEGGTLPLAKGGKLTVFGKNSVDVVLGGSGSNASRGDKEKVNVNETLRKAGFVCNPATETFYKSVQSGKGRPQAPDIGMKLTGFPTGETPTTSYPKTVKDSYLEYNDGAIVIISRIGGEGFDLPRSMFWDGESYENWNGQEKVDGARAKEDHYLQLDQNEADMLQEACANFDKVIVVINSASPIETGFLDDPTHYAYHENVKAGLWIGHTAKSGISALGKILNGEVNPSGKTVDTYVRNFKNDPTWHNFGNSLMKEGNRYTLNGNKKDAFFVEYREGIYTGYRYYETKAFYEGEDWYKENVVYPFGYGLSYTEFRFTVTPSLASGSVLSADGKLSFEVEVENVGTKYDGKESLQLYYTSPYTEGGIEKPRVVLGDFAKTELVEKNGGRKNVTLEIDVRALASYDYNDKNGNGFKGYEAEGGEYTFYVLRNAHGWTEKDAVQFTYTVPAGGFLYEKDGVTEEKVENLFDGVSGQIKEYLSRENSFENENVLQGASDAQYRNVTDKAFFDAFNYRYGDGVEDPWYANEFPQQSKRELSYKETKIKLFELIGKGYEDPLWEQLLNQLTVAQMTALVSSGDYRTLQLENIDKPQTIDADGAMGFVSAGVDGPVYDTCYYACACVVGATWNPTLSYEMGKMIGNEGLVGDERADGRVYSGWYAPAVNLHRSPFGGRNFEYYSEDGLLSGKIAAALVRGANEKGVYTYVKHFALNEQETNRDTTGLITWANEQSLRELYFKPFEICVKEGKTKGIMTGFNRIGGTWVGGSYPLLTKLLRQEWGFEGMVVTDYNSHSYMNVDQMLRAGGDLTLSVKKVPHSETATDVAVIRQAAKNILYTVANSNAMNGFGENVVWGYRTPNWTWALIFMDAVSFSLAAFLFAYPYLEKRKNVNRLAMLKEKEQECGEKDTQ